MKNIFNWRVITLAVFSVLVIIVFSVFLISTNHRNVESSSIVEVTETTTTTEETTNTTTTEETTTTTTTTTEETTNTTTTEETTTTTTTEVNIPFETETISVEDMQEMYTYCGLFDAKYYTDLLGTIGAAGVDLKSGTSCAIHTGQFPLGTVLYITCDSLPYLSGYYTCDDTGCDENVVDLYFYESDLPSEFRVAGSLPIKVWVCNLKDVQYMPS